MRRKKSMPWLAEITSNARRMSAVLLLVCLLSPLFALAASAGPLNQALLPACCRTHGKHRCSMGHIGPEGSSTRSDSIASHMSERCPFQGVAIVPHLPERHGLPSQFFHHHVLVIKTFRDSHLTSAVRHEIFHSPPKRGPPNSSASSHEF
jgi:hypothetical protein